MEEIEEEVKSRTRKKKEDRALQTLGEQLVTLSFNQLEQLGLEEELLEAVVAARKTKSHGARRRQMQYIGVLMRDNDASRIQAALDNIRLGDAQQTAAYRKIETWRNEIKNGNVAIIQEILAACPNADHQTLIQFSISTGQEGEGEKGKTSSRALFQYLKKISQGSS